MLQQKSIVFFNVPCLTLTIYGIIFTVWEHSTDEILMTMRRNANSNLGTQHNTHDKKSSNTNTRVTSSSSMAEEKDKYSLRSGSKEIADRVSGLYPVPPQGSSKHLVDNMVSVGGAQQY